MGDSIFRKAKVLPLIVDSQPNDTTCGPTCLHSIYRFYDDDISLNQVIDEVYQYEGGGTGAVWLANHALKRGYRALLYTYNVNFFDPTWFPSSSPEFVEKLKSQFLNKSVDHIMTLGYIRFLELGGKIFYRDFQYSLIKYYISKNIPIISGINFTYLYDCPRESKDNYDDIKGHPTGHFVVVRGYDNKKQSVFVSDPYDDPNLSRKNYQLSILKFTGSLFLGALTNDANLLLIYPER